MAESIVKSVTVNCSVEHAFNVFVNRIGGWWPLASHAVSVADGKAALDATIEPKVGGEVYETKHDGSRTKWGTVLEYDQFSKFAMSWHPGTNIEKPTRVDVEFEVIDGKTNVTLTHTGWEIWGDESADKIAGYTSGWGMMLDELYAAACEAA
ncbi:MAG: SRPBCC domain-containing protein [Paracoccaceae bacterium]|nr:SRPBCC domain-containing protein [Paracoccaceae bacterium]MDG2258301.1 SRPBCC domain-containing protein [Paracoccaceae bacterium]